ASAVVGGIPGVGTMGASLINISSGGTTHWSGLVTGVASLLALLLLAPLIAWVPVAALAGILIVTGFRMIDRHSFAFFFTPATRLDFLVILSVIVVALFGNLIAASGVGVALAILLFIREQTRSSIVRSRTDGLDVFARRAHGPNSVMPSEFSGSDAVVFELQGSLFFGTASQLHAALEPETGSRKYVILNMRRVQSLDVTATHVLEQIKDQLEKNNAFLVFCDIPKGLPSGLKMKRFLKETGVVCPTSKAFAFRQLEDALKWVEEREHAVSAVDWAAMPALDLGDMPVLSGCAAEAVTALSRAVHRRSVHAGKKLFKLGHGDDCLYLVRSGRIGLDWPLQKKERLPLCLALPGSVVCGPAFYRGGIESCEAVAVDPSEVYVLSRTTFNALVLDFAPLGPVLLDAVARNLLEQCGGLAQAHRAVSRGSP
ncbi:MAG: STAS domain-containing protein, partial [Rhodoferax sp.]|nr:STAS domain-containing protein [Rhodoferax sp.]